MNVNNRPRALRDATPGKYLVRDGEEWAFYVEVAPNGDIHQLKPDTLQRDGRLSDEGWRPGRVVRIEKVIAQ